MTSSATHWEKVWTERAPDEVSWFQLSPGPSLRLIGEAIGDVSAPIIDVGGGASTLVDALLDAGHTDITVLDISERSLDRARERLGERARHVTWTVGDVTTWEADRPYALWHDRAVLHFLVDEEDRRRYADQLRSAVADDGHVIIATFGPDGPEMCSGLPVRRHGPDDLALLLGPTFEAVTSEREVHVTPKDVEQAFVYGLFRRSEAPGA